MDLRGVLGLALGVDLLGVLGLVLVEDLRLGVLGLAAGLLLVVPPGLTLLDGVEGLSGSTLLRSLVPVTSDFR